MKDECMCQYCIDKRKRKQQKYQMDGLVFLLLMMVIMVVGTAIVVSVQ